MYVRMYLGLYMYVFTIMLVRPAKTRGGCGGDGCRNAAAESTGSIKRNTPSLIDQFPSYARKLYIIEGWKLAKVFLYPVAFLSTDVAALQFFI